VNESTSPTNETPELLTADSRVCRQEGVVLRHVAGEHMLVPSVSREVDLDSLFLLNATGVFVWEQMESELSVADLSAAVAGEFSIDPDAAAADVVTFLSSLLERKLAVRA
jgi:Coenzyme PQQ synthesis protein D (PqqD)